ncbi:hypothetical protein H9I48_03480 [Wolbachia pipientis]|nr:hypothetical protein [Wolbachia pipientis]
MTPFFFLDPSVTHWDDIIGATRMTKEGSVSYLHDTTCHLQIAMFVRLCVTRWNDKEE